MTQPPYDKAYCLTRSDYHAKEAQNAKRDAETVASDPAHTLQSTHFEMFMKLHEEHTRYAKAWRESAEEMK